MLGCNQFALETLPIGVINGIPGFRGEDVPYYPNMVLKPYLWIAMVNEDLVYVNMRCLQQGTPYTIHLSGRKAM